MNMRINYSFLINSLLCNLFLLFLFTFNVYATSLYTYTSDYIITKDTKPYEISNEIKNNLGSFKSMETVSFYFRYNLDNIDKLKYLKEFQKAVIERLDGIYSVTPSIKTSYTDSKITFKITPYYCESLDNFDIYKQVVENGKMSLSDKDKIYIFSNFLYDNKFVYASDNSIEFSDVHTSNIYENLNIRPDGVLSRKKAICSGFANLAMDYLDKVGIPNVKIRGYLNTKNGQEYHTWNLVYININDRYDWYSVDFGGSIYKRDRLDLIKDFSEMYKEVYIEDKNLINDNIDLKYEKYEDLGVIMYRYSIPSIKSNINKEGKFKEIKDFIYTLKLDLL